MRQTLHFSLVPEISRHDLSGKMLTPMAPKYYRFFSIVSADHAG